jgi:hypothetical protein
MISPPPLCLCQEQITAFVPGTNRGLCSWNKSRLLFLTQITAFVPGTNHGLCSWHKPRPLFLAQITAFVPGTNQPLQPNSPPTKTKKRNTTCPLNKLCFYPLLQTHILTWVYRIRFGCIPCTYMKFKV